MFDANIGCVLSTTELYEKDIFGWYILKFELVWSSN